MQKTGKCHCVCIT